MLLRRKLWTYIFYLVKKYFSLKNTEQMSEKTNQKEVCGQKKTAQQNKCGQAKVLSICRKYIGRTGQKNFAFSRKALDKMCGLWYNLSCCRKAIWVWRSLVARYLGVVEAVGSNPATQTISSIHKGFHLWILDFLSWYGFMYWAGGMPALFVMLFSARWDTPRQHLFGCLLWCEVFEIPRGFSHTRQSGSR